MLTPAAPAQIETAFGPARLLITSRAYIAVNWKRPTIDGQNYYSAAVYVSGAVTTAEATRESGPDTVQLVDPPASLKDEARRLYSIYAQA